MNPPWKLHYSPLLYQDILCGRKPAEFMGEDWNNRDILDDPDKRYYPCMACVTHPDYPLHMLNEEKL